jgi:hypothetical protein
VPSGYFGCLPIVMYRGGASQRTEGRLTSRVLLTVPRPAKPGQKLDFFFPEGSKFENFSLI